MTIVSTMTRLIPRPALALALALGAFASTSATGTAQAAGASARLLGGINVVSPRPGLALSEADHAVAEARALHVKLIRTDVQWALFQPTGPESTDPQILAFTDRLVSDASASGIRVIMTVEGSPCWASSAPASVLASCNPSQLSAANTWPPSNPSTYATFSAFLAQRYGTQLAALEVWNEPDQSNELYFAGPNKAVRYAAVLRAAYTAIKQANPNVPVLGGSLVGSNGAFLRALYAAGIKGYYNGLSVHFYNLTLASLRSIHETQIANGDHTPLWLAEFGWASCWPHQRIQEEQGCVTAKTQASNLTNSLREMARMPYVTAAVAFKLQDNNGEDFGMLSASGAHKPSFGAIVRALTAPFGPVSPVTVKLRAASHRVTVSGSGPVGDFMVLEAFNGSRLRYSSIFTLNRFNRYSIALPSVLGTSGLRVRVYQYLSGKAHAAQNTI
jgi:hypothetical protein